MANKILRPFHLAFPVSNIKETKKWYTEILGCSIGREAERWIDFNFFGHQISAHLSDQSDMLAHNEVDSKQIPSRHFGIILAPSDWDTLAKRLADLKIEFKWNSLIYNLYKNELNLNKFEIEKNFTEFRLTNNDWELNSARLFAKKKKLFDSSSTYQKKLAKMARAGFNYEIAKKILDEN